MTYSKTCMLLFVATMGVSCDKAPPPVPTAPATQAAAPVTAQPVRSGPAHTAERLRRIKGTALYRPLGVVSANVHAVNEVELSVAPGEPALVTVSDSQPHHVRLAVVRKLMDGTLPKVAPDGRFADDAHAVWVTPQPFLFGGAAWDETRRFLVWGEMELGGRLAVSPDGLREKVSFSSISIKGAAAEGLAFAKPTVLAVGSFAKGANEGPMQFNNAALWPESINQRQPHQEHRHVLTLTFIVDSLVAPDYLGDDRPPNDGRYVAVFAVSGRGWKLLQAPQQKGPYVFAGEWINGAQKP